MIDQLGTAKIKCFLGCERLFAESRGVRTRQEAGFINKSEPKRNANLFWGLGLDESADVLPVSVAKLLDGVQQPHLLPRVPLFAPIDAVAV